MTKGISFNFDKNGELSIKPNEEEKQECFGGVLCISAQHIDGEIVLDSGVAIPTRTYFCTHANKPVTDFMMNQCPVGHWYRLKDLRSHSEHVDIIWGKVK